MTNKPDGKRWKTGDKWVTAAVALFAAYMVAYYATISADYSDHLPFYTYKIGHSELPSWSQCFFAPANWIDDRIHVAPCKHSPSIPIR